MSADQRPHVGRREILQVVTAQQPAGAVARPSSVASAPRSRTLTAPSSSIQLTRSSSPAGGSAGQRHPSLFGICPPRCHARFTGAGVRRPPVPSGGPRAAASPRLGCARCSPGWICAGRPRASLGRPRLDGVLPRARLDVEAALDGGAPGLRGRAPARRGRGPGADQAVRRRGPGQHQGPAAGAGRRAGRPRARPVRAALQEAARRARLVHEAQVPPDSVTTLGDGATVTERYVPVSRAGVYVPGGLVAYPSSVVMNVIPAQVAGVAEIAVASPPRPEHGGLPHPAVLAACALLGVTEVHAAGGAQAIAMLGYGTEDCAPVDTISGPGQRLRGRGQAAAARPGRDRRGGGPDRDRDHRGRVGGPGARRGRPGRAGRARRAGRLPADHHRSRARRPRRRRAGRAGRRGPAPGADRGRPGRPVRVRAGRRRRRRAGRLRRLGPRAPGDPGRAGAPSSPRGSATRARCSSGRTRRCRSATTWRAPTTCCPPAGPPGTRPGCRC